MKKWKDPSDPLNIKLIKHLTNRTKEGIPIIPAYTIKKHGEITDIIPFNYIKSEVDKLQVIPKDDRFNKFVHFFIDDYQFERLWNYPRAYNKYMKSFAGACSPGYSLYQDYYLIDQKINLHRNRVIGSYWAYLGIPVIPTVSWGDDSTLHWCFQNIWISIHFFLFLI